MVHLLQPRHTSRLPNVASVQDSNGHIRLIADEDRLMIIYARNLFLYSRIKRAPTRLTLYWPNPAASSGWGISSVSLRTRPSSAISRVAAKLGPIDPKKLTGWFFLIHDRSLYCRRVNFFMVCTYCCLNGSYLSELVNFYVTETSCSIAARRSSRSIKLFALRISCLEAMKGK